MTNEIAILDRPSGLVETPIIELALKQLKGRAGAYNKFHAYYDGAHPLTYATEKYRDNFARIVAEYSENLCPAVIESLGDRLTVTGFTQEGTDALATPASREAWRIWKYNRMDENSAKVHTEALKAGDAFVIVWPDERPEHGGEVRIWPQDANGCTVYYNESNDIEWAAKWWLLPNNYGRLNLYFVDRIERYITNNKVAAYGGGFPTKREALTRMPDGESENPYGRVPMFHFPNDALIANWGKSELRDVIPIQDALNKAVCDMLVGMEFNAYPQRHVTGLTLKTDPATGKPIADFAPGVDRIWSTASKEAKFGEFSAADLNQLLNVQNRFKSAIADVTGTPAHYLQMTPGNWPSGESLKTAEARFIAKAEKRQIAYGNVWEDIMTFALSIAGVALTDQRLTTLWKNAAPRSELDAVTIGETKIRLEIPASQVQKELGYTDEEIKRFASEVESKKEADVERQRQLFDAGNGPPEDEE